MPRRHHPNRLSEARRQAELSAAELARRSDMSPMLVRLQEKGERGIPRTTVLLYSKILQVDPIEIFVSPEIFPKNN